MPTFFNLHKDRILLGLHLILIATIVLAVMLRMEGLVKTLLKCNLTFSFAFIAWQYKLKNHPFVKLALKLAILPGALLLLNYIATGHLNYKDYSRNIFNAYGLAIITAALAFHDQARLTDWGTKLAKLLTTSYTIIQLLAIQYHWGDYGTTKNPHFLALYAAICLCVSLFFYFRSKSKFRIFYIVQACILLGIVLFTSSRPVWIGLILSTGFVVQYLKKENWLKYATVFVAVQLLLIYTDLYHYRSRFYELITHITTEERVMIWQDAWVLQKGSDFASWFYGHGLNSFLNDFKVVSRYHVIYDVKSPHNLFLEILYTTGVVGVSVVFAFYYLLYRNWLFYKCNNSQHSHLASVILIITTVSLILNGLNFPFASTSSIYPVAFITGLVLILNASVSANRQYKNT
jgi:O-Antigen ligase